VQDFSTNILLEYKDSVGRIVTKPRAAFGAEDGFLSAFAKLRIAAISFVMSVRMKQLGFH
jgi:hypothetical protein